jgi:hypothetical protein
MPWYAAAVTLTTLALGSLVAGNRIVSAEHEPTAIVEAGALHTAGAGKAALTGCEVVPEFLPLEQCYPEPKNPLEHLTPTSSTTSTTSTTRPRPTTTVAPRVVQQRASRSAAPRSVMPPAQATAPPAPVNGNKVDWMNAAGIAKENQGYVDGIMTPESGWNPAIVSRNGCIGLGQNCPDRYGHYWLKEACPNWQQDPVCQLRRFEGYAIGRYGSWKAAYQYRQAHHSW